jgi:hypothetical protein
VLLGWKLLRFLDTAIGDEHLLHSSPIIVEILDDSTDVMMRVFGFVLSDDSPFVVEDIIGQRADEVVCSLAPGRRDDTISARGLDPLV